MKKINLGLVSIAIIFNSCGQNRNTINFTESPSKKAIVLEEFVFTESPTRDCHASSLLELENGDLLCTWFGGTSEGAPDVKVWLSLKPSGGPWQPPVTMGKQYLIRCWSS